MTHPRRSAFSFVEMLIVLIVIGILAAAAAPSFFDSLMIQRVESAARRIKMDIELARRDAMAKSATRVFDFTNTNTYALSGIASLDHPDEVYKVDLSTSPYEVSVKNVDFSGLDNFAFTGYGLPTRGGTIEITAGSHARIIQVDNTTGRVDITSN